MKSKLEYISKWVTDFSEITSEPYNPIQVKSGGFMICLSGSCKIVIDVKQYNIKQWDMVVAFPHSILQALEKSDNFKCVIIATEGDFISNIKITNKSSYFTTIREYPSIALDQSEVDEILSLSNLLMREREKVDHPFRNEIDESILKMIIYEVAAIYSRREPNREQKNSRDEIIFHSFIAQLFTDFKKERNLGYYAQKQQITASHLSKVVKKVSGRAASDWLIDCVINNIKNSLRNENESIANIAYDYNFANNSFFSQYFKKYSGMTPREYRASFAK